MGRTARDNRDRPHPRPVQRIELPEGNVKLRLIAVAALLLVGAAALGYTVKGLFTPDTGWQTIEADTAGGPTCAGELVFLYELGGSGPVQAENRAVTAAYSTLCREAYRQFSSRERFEDVGNLCDVNAHPNEVVEVGGGLYAALEAVERSGSRVLFLGPVYERYQGVFSCQDDSQRAEFDPRLSAGVAREYAAYASYARDPQAVRLELLGENRVRLAVSGEYLAFAQREGVERFVDFGWTRNAFITDFIADGLAAEGYTRGSLSSYDGFCRNLDGRADYSLPLYSRQDDAVYPAAALAYRGPMALVSLRDYPVNEMDTLRFYIPGGGERRTPYVDLADGLCRNALPELVSYSSRLGCGEVLLAMLPVYIAEQFDPGALDGLKEAGIETLYWEGTTLHSTDGSAQFRDFYQSDGVAFASAG